MHKSYLLWPLLAASLALLSCQPGQTPQPTQVDKLPNLLEAPLKGFQTKDWPNSTGSNVLADMTNLDINLQYTTPTRANPTDAMNLGMPLPSNYFDIPRYDFFVSDYKLSQDGKQYATKGLLIFSGKLYDLSVPVIIRDILHQKEKSRNLTFTAYLESSDGIHFNVTESNGYGGYAIRQPDDDNHGNVACTYMESGAYDFSVQGVVTINEAARSFQTDLQLVNAIGTKTTGLIPWQCSYQCNPNGNYNEDCNSQFNVTGSIHIGGAMAHTSPGEVILRAEPEIFSTHPDVRGATSIYAGNLPGDQLWRLVLPPYQSIPVTVEGSGHSEYSGIGGWDGRKDAATYTENGYTWDDNVSFYQDGTYQFEFISDRHQRKVGTVRIDSTPPIISEPELTILDNGKRQVKIRITDPEVNGVRAGLEPSLFDNVFFYLNSDEPREHRFERIDDFTLDFIGEYSPKPQPTPYPSYAPSSNPSGDPSNQPSYSPSSQTPATPSPYQEPQVYVEFIAKDKARNLSPYQKELQFEAGPLELTVTPKIISPLNQDGAFDTAKFHIRSATNLPWTLTVVGYEPGPLDSDQLPTRGPSCSWSTEGMDSEAEISWDGRCSNGNFMVDGAYVVKLNSGLNSNTGEISIDNTPPDLPSVEELLITQQPDNSGIITGKVRDPRVNGVSSGIASNNGQLDVSLFANGEPIQVLGSWLDGGIGIASENAGAFETMTLTLAPLALQSWQDSAWSEFVLADKVQNKSNESCSNIVKSYKGWLRKNGLKPNKVHMDYIGENKCVTQIASALTELSNESDSFAIQRNAEGIKYIAPPGRNRKENITFITANFAKTPVFVEQGMTTLCDDSLCTAPGLKVKVFKEAKRIPRGIYRSDYKWNGDYFNNTNNVVSDGMYETYAKLSFRLPNTFSLNISTDQVEVSCSGYYYHMPKRIVGNDLEHALDRHYGFQPNTALRDLLLQHSHTPLTNKPFKKALKEIPPSFSGPEAEPGKASMYPPHLSKESIIDAITSVGNLSDGADTCRTSKGNFETVGIRLGGVRIHAYIMPKTQRILSGVPKAGEIEALDFYKDPANIKKYLDMTD